MFSMILALSVHSQSSFADIDRHASKVPKKHTKDIENLTTYLVSPFENPTDMVRSIYTWIGRNIEYDHSGVNGEDYSYNYQVDLVFEKKKAVCTGFANLFAHMVGLANIPIATIPGYTKNSVTSEASLMYPDHVWNAVLIRGEWRLVDATWDAGLWRSSGGAENPEIDRYFMPPPLIFLQDHLPAMEMWQLVSKPYTIEHFAANNIPLTDSTLQIGSYAFKDTIDRFLNLPKFQQKLVEYEKTYAVNPTKKNAELMSHGLMDFAGILSDSLEKIEDDASSIFALKLEREILTYCKKSEKHISFHNWQAKLYANTLISHSVRKYNHHLPDDNSRQRELKTVLSDLERAKEILLQLKSNFWRGAALNECENFIKVIQSQMN